MKEPTRCEDDPACCNQDLMQSTAKRKKEEESLVCVCVCVCVNQHHKSKGEKDTYPWTKLLTTNGVWLISCKEAWKFLSTMLSILPCNRADGATHTPTLRAFQRAVVHFVHPCESSQQCSLYFIYWL